MFAVIDRLDTLNYVERLGVVRSMTRKARVIFTPGDAIPTDFTVLYQALQAAGIPAAYTPFPGPAFTTVPGVPTLDALVLVERAVEIVEQDKGTVDVTLKYEHLLDGPNQQLFAPPAGILYGKGRCSITQKPTNFFYPFGDRTQPRQVIQVAHTYPLTDADAQALVVFPQDFPGTIFQGGEINAVFSQSNFQMEGIIPTPSPLVFARSLVGTVNNSIWQGDPPFTWLCSEAQWEVVDPAQFTYKFQFEFQFDEDTWYPTVVFNDHRTGRPPQNIEDPVLPDPDLLPEYTVMNFANNAIDPLVEQPAGYWQVPYLRPINFNHVFAAFVAGFPLPQVD